MHQQHWHSFEQELWGLLHVKRDKIRALGRIPDITHTDHANLARLDSLPIGRIDAKHYRWFQEIVEGGSLLLHRPGSSALHKGPDGLSRNVEGRDHLILARSADWQYYRNRIRGIQEAIQQGIADDDEQEALTVDKVPKDKLEPLPYEEGLAVSTKYENRQKEQCGRPPSAHSARGEEKGEARTCLVQELREFLGTINYVRPDQPLKIREESVRAVCNMVKQRVDAADEEKMSMEYHLDFPPIEIVALFMGPFAFEKIVAEKAEY